MTQKDEPNLLLRWARSTKNAFTTALTWAKKNPIKAGAIVVGAIVALAITGGASGSVALAGLGIYVGGVMVGAMGGAIMTKRAMKQGDTDKRSLLKGAAVGVASGLAAGLLFFLAPPLAVMMAAVFIGTVTAGVLAGVGLAVRDAMHRCTGGKKQQLNGVKSESGVGHILRGLGADKNQTPDAAQNPFAEPDIQPLLSTKKSGSVSNKQTPAANEHTGGSAYKK